MPSLFRLLIASSVVAVVLPASGNAAGPRPLTAHRAVYDIALVPERSKGMSRAGGRIAFEFQGNACDGYALNFRQVTTLDDGEGRTKLMDMRSTTWEDGEGRSFRFTMKNLVNNQTSQQADGTATRSKDGGVSIALKQPKPIRIDLAGEPVFPTVHTRLLLEAALKGERTLSVPIYDGSDGGETVYDTTSVIGKAIEGEAAGRLEPAVRAAGFEAERRWPVRVSYFEAGKSGDRTPVYVMSFDLLENGIYSNLRFDFDDFTLAARMSQFETLKQEPCAR